MGKYSYDEEACLYLVPTPIGNLKDFTFRAIEVLENVSYIFCEDTRESSKLLKEMGINKKLSVCNEQNEEKAAIKILEYLENNESVALISDRGTPIVSDPGYKVVKYLLDNDKKVVSLPGASALLPALTNSGIEPHPFCFIGFLNSKRSKRKKELSSLKSLKMTLVFYESPHRIIETLEDLLKVFGNRKISISREITKIHEEIYRGSIESVLEELHSKAIKGEFVIVVEANKEALEYSDEEIVEMITDLIAEGKSKNESIKEVSKEVSKPKSEIYNLYHERSS